MNQTARIAIGLGSNLGNREQSIATAVSRLKEDLLEECLVSSVYESKPWGKLDQPDFFNAVAVGYCDWKPPAIVSFLKSLELELGRLPSKVLYGPRLIDLDLLVWGSQTWNGEGVIVPHPRLTERDFVLLPLSEVWPEWKHPVSGKSARAFLGDATPRTSKVIAPPPQDTMTR